MKSFKYSDYPNISTKKQSQFISLSKKLKNKERKKFVPLYMFPGMLLVCIHGHQLLTHFVAQGR